MKASGVLASTLIPSSNIKALSKLLRTPSNVMNYIFSANGTRLAWPSKPIALEKSLEFDFDLKLQAFFTSELFYFVALEKI